MSARTERDLFSWGCPFSQLDPWSKQVQLIHFLPCVQYIKLQMTEGTSLEKLHQVGHAAEVQINRLLQAAAVTFQVGFIPKCYK